MADKGVLKRLRDRRYKERKRIEEIFDRQTLMSIAVIMPMSKSVEQFIIGNVGMSIRFAVVFILTFLVAVYWHRLSEGGVEFAENVKESVTEE